MSTRCPQHGVTARRASGYILLPVVLALTLIAAVAFLLNRAGGMNISLAALGVQPDIARYVAEAGLAQVSAQTQSRNCTGYTDLGTTAFGAHSFTATVNPKFGTPVTLASTATLADGATSTLTRSNVTVYATTPSTVTLQPIDTYLSKPSSSSNYGNSVNLTINAGNIVSLLRFDLSSIPAGSDIRSAQFSLYHTTGGTDPVSLYRVTKPWTEGTGAAGSGASWNTYDGVQSWVAAGGDYDPAPIASLALPPNGNWANFDLSAQMINWSAGTQPNYGFIVVAMSGGNNAFVSREGADPTQRPKLTVTFLRPCSSATVVILPASQDTWIDETGAGASNHGSSLSFTVTNGSKRGRGLVRFDLSGIPASTVLQSATLRLYAASVTTPQYSTLTVNRVFDPWTEGGATWKTRDGSNGWSAGFGSFWGFGTGAPTSTRAISSSFTSGWVEWDVTDLAQQWVSAPAQNYGAGVLIDTASAVTFNSREAIANQPQLELAY